MQDIQELILFELRALREDYNTHARLTGERLSSLETKMRALAGNGQSGRVGTLENTVEALKAFRWKIIGIAIGVSSFWSFIGWVLLHHHEVLPR